MFLQKNTKLMLRPFNGFGITAVIVTFCVLNSCRTSQPPAMSVCLGDGFGGADCQLAATSPLAQCCTQNSQGWYCPPTCLKDAWITSEAEESAFASWCYGGDPAAKTAVHIGMKNIKESLGR